MFKIKVKIFRDEQIDLKISDITSKVEKMAPIWGPQGLCTELSTLHYSSEHDRTGGSGDIIHGLLLILLHHTTMRIITVGRSPGTMNWSQYSRVHWITVQYMTGQ